MILNEKNIKWRSSLFVQIQKVVGLCLKEEKTEKNLCPNLVKSRICASENTESEVETESSGNSYENLTELMEAAVRNAKTPKPAVPHCQHPVFLSHSKNVFAAFLEKQNQREDWNVKVSGQTRPLCWQMALKTPSSKSRPTKTSKYSPSTHTKFMSKDDIFLCTHLQLLKERKKRAHLARNLRIILKKSFLEISTHRTTANKGKAQCKLMQARAKNKSIHSVYSELLSECDTFFMDELNLCSEFY